jgi:hypothetical protein
VLLAVGLSLIIVMGAVALYMNKTAPQGRHRPRRALRVKTILDENDEAMREHAHDDTDFFSKIAPIDRYGR